MPGGRPRQFDRDAVLDEGVRVFWRSGFGASGTRELCEATGIGLSSLHNAFGGKDEFFAACLDRYVQTVLGGILEALEGDDEPREALLRIIAIWEDHNTQPGSPGCLLMHTLSEQTLRPADAKSHAASAAIDRLRAGFARLLSRARAAGVVERSADADELGNVFVVTAFGMALAGRAGADPALVRSAAAHLRSLIVRGPDCRTG